MKSKTSILEIKNRAHLWAHVAPSSTAVLEKWTHWAAGEHLQHCDTPEAKCDMKSLSPNVANRGNISDEREKRSFRQD